MLKSIDFLGTGINLGNSLDAIGGELAWNNPLTTRDMIHEIAAAGFKTLRIPITWLGHLSFTKEAYVDTVWMNRVKEVAGWALAEGMYAIVNVHHDMGWIHPSMETVVDVMDRYTALWTQIAEAFREYDEHLLFQGLNEPRIEHGENEFNGGTPSVRSAINYLNQAFVHTVRSTGGHNATRWLCIPTYFAQYTKVAMDALELPKDDRLIVTVHFYDPATFVSRVPVPGETPYCNGQCYQAIDTFYNTLQTYREKWNVPILITEFGAESKELPGTRQRNDEERIKYVNYFVQKSRELHFPCLWWDNNHYDTGDAYFALLDRSTLMWHSPSIVKAIVG